jgi:hypothetical protein
MSDPLSGVPLPGDRTTHLGPPAESWSGNNARLARGRRKAALSRVLHPITIRAFEWERTDDPRQAD